MPDEDLEAEEPDEAGPVDEAEPIGADRAGGPADERPPSRRRGSGWGGCALWVLAFVVVVIGGCIAGAALRPSRGRPFVAQRTAGFALRLHDDEDHDPCIDLMIGTAVKAGQCGYGPGGYTVTTFKLVDGRTAAFAPVPEGATRIQVPTTAGVVTVGVQERKGRRWFLYLGRPLGDGFVTPLDAAGHEVPIPPG